jgi:hypothetical protein
MVCVYFSFSFANPSSPKKKWQGILIFQKEGEAYREGKLYQVKRIHLCNR